MPTELNKLCENKAFWKKALVITHIAEHMAGFCQLLGRRYNLPTEVWRKWQYLRWSKARRKSPGTPGLLLSSLLKHTFSWSWGESGASLSLFHSWAQNISPPPPRYAFGVPQGELCFSFLSGRNDTACLPAFLGHCFLNSPLGECGDIGPGSHRRNSDTPRLHKQACITPVDSNSMAGRIKPPCAGGGWSWTTGSEAAMCRAKTQTQFAVLTFSDALSVNTTLSKWGQKLIEFPLVSGRGQLPRKDQCPAELGPSLL